MSKKNQVPSTKLTVKENYPSSPTPSANIQSTNLVHTQTSEDVRFQGQLKDVLRPYSLEERDKIMWFFQTMHDNFSTMFKQMYGTRPSHDFAAFAAPLDESSMQRIISHLHERLVDGKEWPPALAHLSILKDLPLKKEILEARHRILIKRQPETRVEKYIFQRKSSQLRSLSEMNLAEEFRYLYINAYQDVKNNLDISFDSQEEEVKQSKIKIEPTETDLEVDRRIKEGIRPSGRVNELLTQIEHLRKKPLLAEEPQDSKCKPADSKKRSLYTQKLDYEQQALMEQILRETNGDNENL
ncbi:hypothetical protein [Vibrio coralliilyticus]|uniref:hypothetical protein n=1 Tax=Vibrio coralliilyticus TaxID=190893 RepID=UPI0017BC1117|nr:hypothetical protein [Vibrio coralliilyticus]NUW70377.1 hypothetical protein [Vibrio coralliilyticus]